LPRDDRRFRIAGDTFGGGVTSAILELLLYPAILVIWKKRSLRITPDEWAIVERHNPLGVIENRVSL
jgi:hypothetical protein